MDERFLPGLPIDLIKQCYARAAGHEVERLGHLESSAGLVANAFGFFLGEQPRAALLPSLPNTSDLNWPAVRVELEKNLHFPWSGGRHPWLDVLVETDRQLVGIESKRYEPFRSHVPMEPDSDAYWRPEPWGAHMTGYQLVRDELKAGLSRWRHLNARQLFKHALALRTAAHKERRTSSRTPVLYYLYAEPKTWPKRPPASVDKSAIERHREEVAKFTAIVANDEVAFRSGTYRELLDDWRKSPEPSVSAHAAALLNFFDHNI